MSTKLNEMREEIAAKAKTLHDVFEESGTERDFSKIKSLDGDTQSKLDQIETMTKELNELKATYTKSEELEKAIEEVYKTDTEFNAPASKAIQPTGKEQRKTFGDRAVDLKLASNKHREFDVDLNVKTLLERSAGWDPEVRDEPGVVPYALQPLSVMDYIPIGPTNQDTISYMRSTTFTNNAAEVAEGGTYGEAALVWTRQTDEVEKVGVWLPVTDEQVEDVAQMSDIVNTDLTYMLKARAESQCLNGDGSTPNLLGTLNVASIQTQAQGTDPAADAIYKAMVKIRTTGFAEPSVVFLNPNDLQTIRLEKTADGIYLYGDPRQGNDFPLWGVPVCSSTFVVANTGIVGDYRMFAKYYVKRGITIQVTNAHDDYFIKGKQAIRADMRASMVHKRPAAFCTVTGI